MFCGHFRRWSPVRPPAPAYPAHVRTRRPKALSEERLQVSRRAGASSPPRFLKQGQSESQNLVFRIRPGTRSTREAELPEVLAREAEEQTSSWHNCSAPQHPQWIVSVQFLNMSCPYIRMMREMASFLPRY